MAIKKEVKTKVVSFRVTEEEFAEIEQKLLNPPVVGVRSIGGYAHKATVDKLRDRITYINEDERLFHPSHYLGKPKRKDSQRRSATPV